MLSSQVLQSLTSLFSNAASQAEKLFALLEKEQAALLSEDYAELEGLAEEKLSLSQSLDAVEQQRQAILQQAGQAMTMNSMQEILITNHDNVVYQPLIQSWDSLAAWLKKAADQNQLNGILLEKQRQHVQGALRILFGQTEGSSVYDASGDTTPAEYSRSVGVV